MDLSLGRPKAIHTNIDGCNAGRMGPVNVFRLDIHAKNIHPKGSINQGACHRTTLCMTDRTLKQWI
jgi:hypothetical protein